MTPTSDDEKLKVRRIKYAPAKLRRANKDELSPRT